MNTWDVIVIGGGLAGENAAQYAIQGSERTAAIVEPAIVGKVTLEQPWPAVPSFPTVNEVWLRLLESRGARASEEEQ